MTTKSFAAKMSDARRRWMRASRNRRMFWPLDDMVPFVHTTDHHTLSAPPDPSTIIAGTVLTLQSSFVVEPRFVAGLMTSTPRWNVEDFLVGLDRLITHPVVLLADRAHAVSTGGNQTIVYPSVPAVLKVRYSGECREHADCLHRAVGRECAARDVVLPRFSLLLHSPRIGRGVSAVSASLQRHLAQYGYR